MNSESADGKTALHVNAACNYIAELELLLRHGADPNSRDADGRTPLFDAELGESVEAIQALVAAGADVDAQENGGETALHWAAVNGRLCTVEALLRCGASTYIRNRRGATPLIMAPGLRDECRTYGARIVKLLVAHGADVHACDPRGRQAIHYAVSYGYDDLVAKLIQAGADPDAMMSDGRTVRMLAREPSTIRLLEQIGDRNRDSDR